MASNDNVSTGPQTIRLGISSCLLGNEVRYNGGHVRDDFLLNTLGRHVQWVPVCPEVEMGMGIPRENIRLVGDAESPRLVAPKSGTDHTQAMATWSGRRVSELEGMDLHGYILKRDSPSCGLFRVRVYGSGTPSRNGRGVFARELADKLSMLPVEEEGRLREPKLRENFIDRIFAYQRWRRLVADGPKPGGLVDFHASHKLSIMAHNPQAQKELGRLVAEAGRSPIGEVTQEYGRRFMEALGRIATARKHANVLQHLQGYLKNHLDGRDKGELSGLIDQYRLGFLPLIVPLTLLRHHLGRHPVPEWVNQQTYLNPYPEELMLRNQV